MNKNYIPIDLPSNLDHMLSSADPSILKAMDDITQKMLSVGRWSEPEDIIFDPNNIEFAAYWLHKVRKPLTKGMKGYGLEAYFEPFKTCRQTWYPEGLNQTKTYKLSACGDLMLAKHIEVSKDRLYSSVESLIFDSDFAYANLESTLSKAKPKVLSVERQGQTPHINITKAQYDALIKHKTHQFDAVQIANNHIMDCGEEGARVTMAQLKEDDITFLGVYENEQDADRVTFTMMDDIKIGWVSHTFSINGKLLDDEKKWFCDITPFHMVREVDTTRLKGQIQAAREAGCNLVIVTLHWGLEHEFYPHPDQLKWAHEFAELGADAVIGHHPHVCQPYEIYKPKSNPDKRVPIVYSLGNLTPAYGSAATVLSLIANLTISQVEGPGVKQVIISGIEVTPIAFVGVLENDKHYAELVPLKALNNESTSSALKDYVKQINTYADLVLGEGWRNDHPEKGSGQSASGLLKKHR